MFKNWFKKKKTEVENPKAEQEKEVKQEAHNPVWEKAVALQKEYWTFNQGEKDYLLGKYKDGDIEYEEVYRLHHLICMEIHEENKDNEIPIYEGDLKSLSLELIGKLISPESPYRIFHGSFWFGESEVPAEHGNEDFVGHFMNYSVTHLGALEVLTFDENQMPEKLEFIPFDEIQGGFFHGHSMLRPGKLFFEFGEPEQAYWFPMLYGVSFLEGDDSPELGRMTSFRNQFEVEALQLNMGLGFGQQDWLMQGEEGQKLIGLAQVREFAISLQMSDPDFDAKCRGRGIDPDEARKQYGA